MHSSATETIVRRDDLQLPAPYVAPETDTESQIVAAFQYVFSLDLVGMDDEFYDLGGDSLTGEQLGMELSNKLNINFPISRLFDQGSPRKILEALASNTPAITVSSSRPPVFVVHGISGHTVPHPSFYEGLADDQKLVMFELPGVRGDRPVPDGIKGIAAEYVAQVQRDYPEGPVLLASFCSGWLIAIEMTQQFASAGREVAKLTVLDPDTPTNLLSRHLGRRAKRIDQLVTYLLSRRLTGGITEADFKDKRLLALRVKLMDIEFAINRLRAHLTGRRAKNFLQSGFDSHSKSLLRASLRHYWPEPFRGEAYILASAEKQSEVMQAGTFARSMLPNAIVRIVADRHDEITGASGPKVAIALQKTLEEGP